MRQRRAALLAGALALGLVAAACGDDGGSSATDKNTSQTVDSAVAQGVTDQLKSSTTGATATTAAKRPTTIDEWETLWAAERAAVVKKLKDGNFGKSADGKTLTGPDGLNVDLSKCAAGWSDTGGLSDDSIKIGMTAPLSGTASDFGNLPRGMGVLFDYYNAKGGLKDSLGKTRKINFVFRDDAYDAAKTIPLTDELIDSEKVFINMTTGTPPGLKVYEKLNQRCIPQPFVVGGHPAWGDPVNHPWTSGLTLAYNTEAVLWGATIEKRAAEFTGPKIRVASLVANSDFGKAYDSSFKAYIAQSSLKDRVDYQPQLVDVTQPTITNEMTTIAANAPDVFITMTGATQCPQLINEIAQNGMKAKAKILFISSVCKGAGFISREKVGGDGSQSNGWWVVGGGLIDFNASTEDGNGYVKWARDLLATKYDWKTSGSYGLGFTYGLAMMQVLGIAGDLPGGLTRSNYILALRSIEMTNPGLLPGIKFNMSGNRDAYLVEGSELAQYSSDKQAWVTQGDIIELSGKSKPCAYDATAAVCR